MNQKRWQLLISGKIDSLIQNIEDNSVSTISVTGLYSSAKAFAISQTIEKGIHVVLLPNREDASGCVNDLYNLLDEENIYFFPISEKGRAKGSVREVSSKVQRTAAISAVSDYKSGKYKGKYVVVVGYKESLEENVPSEKSIGESILTITKGDIVPFEKVSDVLFSVGFQKVDFVSQPGEFAIRGGIVDLFSYHNDRPYRIDFFGDEVESIRLFDPNTQRTTEELKDVKVYPNIVDFSDGNLRGVPFLSTLPSDTLLWISGFDKGFDLIEESPLKKIYLGPFREEYSFDRVVEFNTRPQPTFNKNFELLCDDIRLKRDEGYLIYIMSENSSQINRLKSIFSTYNLVLDYCEYTIHEGFIDKDSKVCLYTDHQIFDRYRRIKIKRTVEKSERLTLNDINSFREGDYVVHIDHGVGRYGGLVKNKINGKVQEAIKLIYRDNDVLYVSIHSLHRISKYRSGDISKPPRVNKLGTGNWEKLKNQTKSKVKDIAYDLIKLYAQRKASKGFAFSADTYLQHELESSFKYEDTPDQSRAVEQVKHDMESDYPMDRLICGDVGFGKTEVAIRAAFKAVADSKQVAVLVPTTILALQHYNTFIERLGNFPCNVEYISRLKTPKETSSIIARLKSGNIDIIIGTHKLLNKDIGFKDLGLLIIDEEQKFGVAAKEKLRTLKLSVDTLTLSATPIPRTLQFSLLGARDLSIINTPPPNRLPIQTEIIDFNEELIRDIINDELERGGQIFFVHNRVHDIEEIEDILRRIVPGVRICVAHGQMEPKVLEKKILDFVSGDYDILLATTIIESGIDIPNTNTIIINQAQNFGLSDLHQLRGRVGRSNRKAFCYLIVPQMITLSDDSRRRLNAIEAFSDLGSGFNIAMQDLDIRGMGNMLGAEQSGYIAEMGIETYQRILAEAFEEIKGGMEESPYEEKVQKDGYYCEDCLIDTDLEILIPDSYINITAEKIRIYKELDSISDELSLNKFIEGIEDRFGKMPSMMNQLIFVVKLRMAARKRGFEKIVLKNEKLILYFISNSISPYFRTPKFAEIIKTIQAKGGNRYMIKEQNNKLYITVENVKTIEGAYNLVSKL